MNEKTSDSDVRGFLRLFRVYLDSFDKIIFKLNEKHRIFLKFNILPFQICNLMV